MKFKLKQLISGDALEQNVMLHEGKGGFGGSGWKHAEIVMAFAHELGNIHTVLDYGCGECSLGRQLGKLGASFQWFEYDPAVRARARMPHPADLVVCTDVLEHIEPDKLSTILDHIFNLSKKACYLAVATRPANKILPNGDNAHLIIEDSPWWREKVLALNWELVKEDDRRKGNTPEGKPHEIRFWLKK